jgi:hypothetical protein
VKNRLTAPLVITHHRPWHRPALVAGGIALIAVISWSMYEYGQSRAGLDFSTLEKENALLLQDNRKLKHDNKVLSEERAILQRDMQIEKQGYSGIRDSLMELQTEVLELKEEVAFYRSIVSPNESSKGLRIQSFKVKKTAGERAYHYKLVLTQVMKNNRVTSGHIVMSVEGVQNNATTSLSLDMVSPGSTQQLPFRFKYFQNFEGDLVLPKGFVASRIHIIVQSSTARIEKHFDWPTGSSQR